MVRVELLEKRSLLSAALEDGVLVILGTNMSDQIDVELNETTLEATVNGATDEFVFADINSLVIRTFQGFDSVNVSTDIELPTIISTGQGRDTVHGGNGDDVIDGRQGPDLLDGRGGNDDEFGRQGKDTLVGGEGDDVLVGGQGKDNILGSPGDDTLNGGTEEDTLRGGAGDDLVDGGEGDDSVTGGQGTNNVVDDLFDDIDVHSLLR